eukprot:scaffold169678_cov33-Prasinocladus_malaysianus.AAC.2
MRHVLARQTYCRNRWSIERAIYKHMKQYRATPCKLYLQRAQLCKRRLFKAGPCSTERPTWMVCGMHPKLALKDIRPETEPF